MKMMPLTQQQQELVSSNLDIVMWTIRKYIYHNETIFGLGYDDLFQEGCLWLCKAAVDYNGSTLFTTFAKTVVKNGLLSYCRTLKHRQQTIVWEDFDAVQYSLDEQAASDPANRFHEDQTVSEIFLAWLLESLKQEYQGTVRLGIEALELKIKGYTGADIAKMYGVKPNLVGAWISRAKKKLLQNEQFLASLR